VASVACSESTGNIFVGRDDGNLSIFTDCLEEVSTISAHDDIITKVSVNPFNDTQCVTVCWDGRIGLIDCASSQMEVISGHSGIINDVSHNTKQPAVFSTIGKDSFLRQWDSRNIHEGCTSLLPLNQIGSACCWSSQSENLIACGMEDGRIHVIDIRTNNIVTSKINHFGRISKLISPQNTSANFLIAASVDNSLSVQNFDLSELSHNNRCVSEQQSSRFYVSVTLHHCTLLTHSQ
jgi:WD40 repeat protein